MELQVTEAFIVPTFAPLQVMASPGVLALFASQRKNSVLVSDDGFLISGCQTGPALCLTCVVYMIHNTKVMKS